VGDDSAGMAGCIGEWRELAGTRERAPNGSKAAPSIGFMGFELVPEAGLEQSVSTRLSGVRGGYLGVGPAT